MNKLMVLAATLASTVGMQSVFAYTEVVTVASGKDGKTSTTSGYSSFVDKTFWDGGVDPLSDEAANYDFRLMHTTRTPDTSKWGNYSYSKDGLSLPKGFWNGVFKGHSMSFESSVWWKTTSENAITTFNDLKIKGQAIIPMSDGSGYIAGNAELLRKRTAPLLVYQQDTNAVIRGIWLKAKLTGEYNSGFSVYANLNLDPDNPEAGMAYYEKRGGRVILTLDADNSSTFFGNVKVGYRGRIALTSAQAVGAQTSFDEKGVHLLEGGQLACTTAGTVLPSGHNRGVYVESTGGGLHADVDWELDYPVGGSGAVEKTGVGMLTYGGSYAAGDVIVSEGTLKLASGCTLDVATPVVLNGGRFVNESGVALQNVTLGGKGILAVAGGRPTALTSFSADGLVTITLTNMPSLAATSEVKVPVLTLPSAAHKLRVGDFTLAGDYPSWKITIETDANGLQTVYAHVNDAIVNGVSSSWFFEDGTKWKDGNPVGEGRHYKITSGSGRIGDGKTYGLYDFPGRSLLFVGGSMILSKAFVFTCPDMRMFQNGGFRFCGTVPSQCPEGHSVAQQDLAGKLFVASTEASPAKFAACNGMECRVLSVLSGTGKIQFLGISDGTTSQYTLTADNSDYTGIMEVHGYTATNPEQKDTVLTFNISDETNLGSNPHEYHADGLKLGQDQILHPTKSLTLDDENRGLTFATGAKVQTDEGVTLTTKTTPTFESGDPIVKTGLGTWEVGRAADRPTVVQDGASFKVANGSIRPLDADVFADVPVTFAAGTTLRVDGTVTPVFKSVSTEGDGQVYVQTEVSAATGVTELSVPVFATPSASEATAFVARAKVANKIGKMTGRLAVRSSKIGGETYACVYADYSERGMVLIFK